MSASAYHTLIPPRTDFPAKTQTFLSHPPYSSDLSPCSLFPEKARRLQGHRFQSADEVKSASQAELKDMSKNGFKKCFEDLYKRWQRRVVAQGSYFKGGCVSAL
ncbi:hypothetical protein TNCV_4223061 [Trichonephila clavipes]|nr:hypothetical protein TNCV_4223061 [Trichonephila clavipes]